MRSWRGVPPEAWELKKNMGIGTTDSAGSQGPVHIGALNFLFTY